MTYQTHIAQMTTLIADQNGTWDAISAESVARMRLQNRFATGLDIARYTAAIMRKDMAAYDADPANYTQSLGCWHGFIAQQKMISIKKHFGTTDRRYLYLSGWMVAALRSEFGPLPDQSMHEKTSVPALIEELYTFLRQADARELGLMFRELDAARAAFEAERCVVMFPAGRLARVAKDGSLTDPDWAPTAASMARKYGAPIVPIHVAGPTSKLFHLFDRISPELRDITLFHELLNKRKKAFHLKVGKPIPPMRLDIDAARATYGLKAFTERVLPSQPDAEFA